MAYYGWDLLGGFRVLGAASVDLLGGVMDFRMVLETGLTLELVNLNGAGGAGALREKQIFSSDTDV